VAEPAPGTFFTWNRAHFGAWVIVSAPLILGMRLTDEVLGPVLDVVGNREAIAINQQWAGHPGLLVETIAPQPIPYTPKGATIPSSSPADYKLSGGAAIGRGPADKATTGEANIRTGGPGGKALILLGVPLTGMGHKVDSISLTFRYAAGYTPAQGEKKHAPTVRGVLLAGPSLQVVAELGTTAPLGNHSWDHFSGFSPPVHMEATGLGVPNDKPLLVALEVTNNDRNLQIPIDDLAAGMDVRVKWASTTAVAPVASASVASASASASSSSTTTTSESAVAAVAAVAASLAHSGEPTAPSLAEEVDVFGVGQLWAKRQPQGALAVLLINFGTKPLNHTVQMASLNLTASTTYDARDVWAHASMGVVIGSLTLKVPPFDSALVLLSPRNK